jgi:hypothetical protein
MPVNNPKITRHNAIPLVGSCVLLLTTVFTFVGHLPVPTAQNPPWHEYGGFDFAYWRDSWIIFGAQFVAAMVIRLRYGRNGVLTIVIGILLSALLINAVGFLMALSWPPI